MLKYLTIIKTNWAAFTLAILVAITFLSLWPLEELPSVPGSDIIHHLIAYALLMLPTALRKPDKWIILGLLFIAYSGAIELIQPYVNRYGEWMDMCANAAGVICGLIIAELIHFFISPKPKNSR
jgi:NhaP-type Na+/H+ or K+/H+ antiporter